MGWGGWVEMVAGVMGAAGEGWVWVWGQGEGRGWRGWADRVAWGGGE